MDLFLIEIQSNNQVAIKNAVDVIKEEPNDVLESHEVKCERALSDEERAVEDRKDAATNPDNNAEATSVLVERIKNSRNIDRLSQDSRVSVDYAPSTSNIPLTPRIDSEMPQGEMEVLKENCATTIKMEDEDYESSIESEKTVLNESNLKSKIKNQSIKRSYEPDESPLESPDKKPKIDQISALCVSNMETKGRYSLCVSLYCLRQFSYHCVKAFTRGNRTFN